MKRQSMILAGTALGLLMASAPLGASPLSGGIDHGLAIKVSPFPLILAQAECEEGTEDCAPKERRQRDAAPEEEQQPRGQRQNEAAQPEPQAAPQPEPQAAPEPAPEQQAAPEPEQPRRKKQREAAQPEPQAAPEPAPEQQAAPEPEQPRRKKQREAAQPEPQAAPEPAPDQQAEPEPEQPRRKKQREAARPEPQAAPEQAPAQQAAPEPEQKPRRKKQREAAQPEPQAAPEQAPAQQAAPAEQQEPRPEKLPHHAAQPEQDGEQAGEPKSRREKLRDYLKNKQQPEQGQAAEQPTPPAKPEPPKAGNAPAGGATVQEKPAPVGEPQLPADTRQQAMPKPRREGKPRPENAAPLPDSAKTAPDVEQAIGKDGRPIQKPRRSDQRQADQGNRRPEALPQSDSAAQVDIGRIGRIESVDAVQGRRLDRDQWREERRRQREQRHDRDGGEVLKEMKNRFIVRFGDDIYVDNRDANSRLERHARDSYVEELPGDFTRYTIVKEDGTRVVTIRNADGDIVRRSRILPNNREVVLYYVPEADYGRIRRGYRDAGADLPPLRLGIPADEYILDAQYADPDDYYTYLDAPPVEPVERIYSVDEVVHSARIRDKVRRIDLDTVTFDTGSAEIGQDQLNRLQALGDAINRILDQNPAETFLIEGHTDAVGSDESNLVLSDERAQSVAEALTSVFDIPAENLTTQGYGERYLKVNTSGASRENRRVAVRRITPLVTPVAKAQ